MSVPSAWQPAALRITAKDVPQHQGQVVTFCGRVVAYDYRYLRADVCATGPLEMIDDRHVILVNNPDAIAIQGAVPVPPRPYPPDAVQSCTANMTMPKLLREVKPSYTPEAMRRKAEGRVLVDALVLPDGTVGDVRLIYSLDPTSGLDAQAIRAVKRWRFVPGSINGRPVPTIVQVELSFTLRGR